MDTNKIKEFISMREELHASGVISVSMWENEIHLQSEKLREMSNLQFEPYNSVIYPYKAFVVEDGIKYFALIGIDEVAKFQQLEGYMAEDVDLTGGEEIVS